MIIPTKHLRLPGKSRFRDGAPKWQKEVCDGWDLRLFVTEAFRMPDLFDRTGSLGGVVRTFVAKLISQEEILEAGSMDGDGTLISKPSRLCKKRVGKEAWEAAWQEMMNYLTVRAVMES